MEGPGLRGVYADGSAATHLTKALEGLRAQSLTLSFPVGPELQSRITEALDQRLQSKTSTDFHIKGLALLGIQTPQLKLP